jgi:hypothetical protein
MSVLPPLLVDGLLWIAGSAVGLFVLDRALLWAEGRGWIYYRRTRPGRGASTYHLLEMSNILDPSVRPVQEVKVKERKSEDEAGDPPPP